jgi:hypothetical protein
MRVETHDIRADTLEIWRSQVGGELLPVQERALKEFGRFSEASLRGWNIPWNIPGRSHIGAGIVPSSAKSASFLAAALGATFAPPGTQPPARLSDNGRHA